MAPVLRKNYISKKRKILTYKPPAFFGDGGRKRFEINVFKQARFRKPLGFSILFLS
jgi:hypothetical protein